MTNWFRGSEAAGHTDHTHTLFRGRTHSEREREREQEREKPSDERKKEASIGVIVYSVTHWPPALDTQGETLSSRHRVDISCDSSTVKFRDLDNVHPLTFQGFGREHMKMRRNPVICCEFVKHT